MDLCGLGIRGYFASLVSYFEILMTCIIVGFLFYEVPHYIEEVALNDHLVVPTSDQLRVADIAILLLLNLQLFRFLKIFAFFQAFIR